MFHARHHFLHSSSFYLSSDALVPLYSPVTDFVFCLKHTLLYSCLSIKINNLTSSVCDPIIRVQMLTLFIFALPSDFKTTNLGLCSSSLSFRECGLSLASFLLGLPSFICWLACHSLLHGQM